MTDALGTIWATRGDAGTGCWNAEKSRMVIHMPDGWETEYTRADIANARIAELEAALKNIAEADDMYEPCGWAILTARAALAAPKPTTEEAPCSQL